MKGLLRACFNAMFIWIIVMHTIFYFGLLPASQEIGEWQVSFIAWEWWQWLSVSVIFICMNWEQR